ncbi:MAG: hypothetical protein JRG83_22245, partial [Deltaproteobacteria bacterium]|nr:hypothetical protein [Deltaproteobacteria bacterium]
MAAAANPIQQALDWASASIAQMGRMGRIGRAEPAAATPPVRPSILPKNYLVEFIAGTFGPASSGRGLTDHLESEQKIRRVATRTNLGVMAAQDLEESSRRKLEEVHVTRAVKFKHEIGRVIDYLRSGARRDPDRPHLIREIFCLDDSAVAQQIALRMAQSHFLERLAEESAAIPEGPLAGLWNASTASHFVELEGRFRTEFASFIPDYEVDDEGIRRAVPDDKALKIINRVFDTFAPRMFLIGHSQGGLVALRAMQLGMRRVRVKDARRFLYSPRSGRVHRYSPVALAIGLGAPFDGIGRRPAPLDESALHKDDLPCFIRRLMPGVEQMIHGSAFLKELRGVFIPFDCSAISIANPKDGFVPLEGTRLPVATFQNMHNLDVGASERFDVADMAPPFFRPALEVCPGLGFRKMMNDAERFEGLRQHCSFLVDLGTNWDVDKGEIVRQIFTGESGQGLFDEMMYGVNFDGVREQLMANLLYRLRAANPDEREHLAWMTPRLRHMIHEEDLPFINSIDKRAA